MIWERSFPRQFQGWLDQLDSSSFQNLRVLIQPDHLPRAIKPHLDGCGIGAGDMRDFLIKDIGELISVFAGITKSRLVDVRLDVISHDACWKFHRDWVERRLLTTYRGPTTEWVHPQYAARAMSEQKRFTGPVEQLKRIAWQYSREAAPLQARGSCIARHPSRALGLSVCCSALTSSQTYLQRHGRHIFN